MVDSAEMLAGKDLLNTDFHEPSNLFFIVLSIYNTTAEILPMIIITTIFWGTASLIHYIYQYIY